MNAPPVYLVFLDELGRACKGAAQALQVLRTGNLDRAEAGRVVGQHLDVEEQEAALAEVIDQVCQRNFGRVAGAAKHRFAGKEAAQGHAVDAPPSSSPCQASTLWA